MTDLPFPNEDALCESCGYALRGLRSDGDCPECGQPIAASSPVHRVGPAWQRRMDAAALFRTTLSLAARPRVHYRTMCVDGSNLAPRLYLLGTALVMGVIWLVVELVLGSRPALLAYLYSMIAGKSVIVLTYIEVLGVTYFSRKRGWRVPLHLAERIGCYASPGLLLAGMAILKLRIVLHGQWVSLPYWMTDVDGGTLFLYFILFAISILGFETLVWIGVRQCRYANRAG